MLGRQKARCDATHRYESTEQVADAPKICTYLARITLFVATGMGHLIQTPTLCHVCVACNEPDTDTPAYRLLPYTRTQSWLDSHWPKCSQLKSNFTSFVTNSQSVPSPMQRLNTHHANHSSLKFNYGPESANLEIASLGRGKLQERVEPQRPEYKSTKYRIVHLGARQIEYHFAHDVKLEMPLPWPA